MEISGGGESSRASSSFMKKGDRQLFKVNLRPGDTTIVSWKKLLKDADKVNGSSGQPANPPAATARTGLESRLAPGQPGDLDKDAPTAHRFSAVIEKIERLYTGNNSSDEEDLGDIPDDDQYDTEDSFIDDAELDEYFEVDNSAIKHDGFFVNRGKLERIEPTVQPAQQLKKRRRRDLGKIQGEGDNERVPKLLKVGRTAAGKATGLLPGNSHAPSKSSVVPAVLPEDTNGNNQQGTFETAARKKPVDAKVTMEPHSANKVLDGGSSYLSLAESKDLDKQKTGNFQSKNPDNKLKAIAGDSSTLHQKNSGKSVSGIELITTNEHKKSALPGEKKRTIELPHAGTGAKCRPMKNQHLHKKDASNVRPKISMLEKAIRDLEKIVAESRPPIMDNQDADASLQGVKRRLPREVKQKLAKVARLAQASHGKITKDLLSRLMSILGHLIQLRTLKRNLKEMISSGLSAKQEKDVKFQHIKKELSEMIKVQVPLLESKTMEQKTGDSDDFQDVETREKGVHRKLSMDAALENKICDLYDLFVDGLDEDAGPQLRKLYAELARLWPNGLMDNHGIKQAIYKARERRRAIYSRNKEQEKIKRKKILATKSVETVRAEAGPFVQSHSRIQETLATEAGNQDSCSVPGDNTVVLAIHATNPVPSTTASVRASSSSVDGARLGGLKQEMSKGGSDDRRVSGDTLLKKKVKGKPEVDLGRGHVRQEKLTTLLGEEKLKSQKHATGLPHRISPQHRS